MLWCFVFGLGFLLGCGFGYSCCMNFIPSRKSQIKTKKTLGSSFLRGFKRDEINNKRKKSKKKKHDDGSRLSSTLPSPISSEVGTLMQEEGEEEKGKNEKDISVAKVVIQEEEGKNEKDTSSPMVYVRIDQTSCATCVWHVIDPRTTPPSYKEDHQMRNCPPVLSNLRFYANVVYGSKIYFLGGEFRRFDCHTQDYELTATFSDKVFAFDTTTYTWDNDSNLKSMKSARGHHKAVLVTDKVYLFGSSLYHTHLLTLEQWGECYNIETGTSVYLSQPPKTLYDFPQITSTVVYQSYILFWVYPRGCIHMFDFVSDLWRSVDLVFNAPIYQGPCWSERVAMVDNALIWHHAGTLYGYDFVAKQSLTLCSFEAPYLKACGDEQDYFPKPTYLVHTGNGRLCLVWSDLVESEKFHCHTFRVKRQGQHTLTVAWEASSTFTTDCYGIEDVLVV